MTDSFSSTDQSTTSDGTEDSQVNANQTDGNQYSVAGKSFQDWNSVKNSYEHQESHIKTLETERDADRQRIVDLEAKVSQSTVLDEVLQRIERSNTGEGTNTSVNLDQLAQQVASKVESGLQAKQVEDKQDSNWKTVTDKLTDTYGDKVDEQVQIIAKAHSMSLDEAVTMARTRPTVFLSLFKEANSTQSAHPTHGTINTSALGVDVERETPKTSVLDLRTDAERVANYAARLDELYKQQGINT